MWILEPLTIGFDQVTASNILEDDAPEWSAGSFDTGDVVILNHVIYESLKDSNTVELGTTDDGVDWLKRSSTNKFKPFDQKNISPAQNDDLITYTIKPGRRIDTIAFVDLDCVSVEIAINIPGQPTAIYTSSKNALRSENRATFHDWFFADRVYTRTIVFTDIPAYENFVNATIDITISRSSGVAKVGEILFGKVWKVGKTLYETAPRIVSFSVDRRDDFGNLISTKRRATRSVSYRFVVETSQIDYVLDRISNLTATKLLFMAGLDFERRGTTLFGTQRDLTIPIEGPSKSEAQIEVEGFIG